MSLNIIKKDLIKAFKENEINVIIQQCNCFNTQGSGLAKNIRQEYPEVYNVDAATIKGYRSKLGTFTHAVINRENISPVGYIINLYGQYAYGGKELQTDYEAQRKGLKSIAEFLYKQGTLETIKIGVPLLGCGLANGDWSIVEQIIQEELIDKGFTVFVYNI